MATTLVIADDHYAIWDAVISWLAKKGSFEVLAQVADGFQALQACVTHRPDLLLLDISMSGLSGLQVIGGLRKTASPPKIVVYTADDTPEMAFECISEGAKGYVIKSSPRQNLMVAVETVLSGNIYIDPAIKPKVEAYIQNNNEPVLAIPPPRKPTTTLTERETEILQLLAVGSGKSSEIASLLYISRNTVNNHISSIYEKLGVNNRNEAVREARKQGIIQI